MSLVDDCDLDDAELWEVIDSAAASRSAKKRPAQSVSSHHSTMISPDQGKKSNNSSPLALALALPPTPCRDPDGEEVVQRPPLGHPPSKMARLHNYSDSRRVHHSVSPRKRASAAETLAEYWGTVREGASDCVNGLLNVDSAHKIVANTAMPSAAVFKQYQHAAMSVLEKGDYIIMQGKPFIKKSGWRKMAFFFNISFEIKDRTIQLDPNSNVIRAEFVVRASMQGGRFADGWGSCDRGEKRFSKPNHDIPSTAETRAKTRACQDLLGIGEYKPGGAGF